VSYSLAGLVFGAAGLVLFFMSFCTNHDYTYHNANVLFGTPLLLAAVPLGIRYALFRGRGGRGTCEKALRLIWLITAAGVIVSMVIKLLPGFWQQNLTDQMLVLPIALTLAVAPGFCRKLNRPAGAGVSGRD
jgi:peptidoglycan/LPS O-acetylase OafA/YrhL